MPHWMIKAAIQGSLSLLPQPQRFNRLFQQHVTRSLTLTDDNFSKKWSQSARHVAYLHRHGQLGAEPGDFVVLELGTGWFPVNPLGLALAGAGTVYTVDTQDLSDRGRTIETLERCASLLERGRLELPHTDSNAALARLRELLGRAASLDGAELLAALGIRSLITDARALDLPANSVDLVCSNNTLEHIPGEVIAGMLPEFARVLRPGGLMSHFIDMADHYAGFDRSISEYNFLRYADPVWRLFNNELQYQNRLRLPDFRRLHEAAGFELVDEDNRSRPLEVLRAVPLAAKFRRYAEDELAVYDTWMVSRPRQ